jgi:hypothetical protein
MRRLGWVGLCILLWVACTVQEPIVVDRPTEPLPAFAHLEFREQIGGHIQAVVVADGEGGILIFEGVP